MDRRETERLVEVIRQARAAGEPAALATIVRVTGSAYRREGTRMVVRQNGTYVCSLSGGCLEPAVAETAARVIASGEPVVVRYDLADDSIWGLGLGCSGAVDVLIERLEDDVVMRTWFTILERSEPAVLVTSLSGVSGRIVVAGARLVAGGLSDAVLEQRAIECARDRLRAPYPGSGLESIADAELFFEIALPAPDLVIFGAGHDAAPVARLAWTLGFAVTVVDVREAFLAPDRFPNATLICAHFSQFADRVKPPAGAFMLVMNHHVERDQESLRFGLESDAAYVGVLGPRSRYEKLLAGLAAQRLHARFGEALARAQPGRALAGRGNAGRSGSVDRGRDPGDSPRVRRRFPQRLCPQPSPTGRQAAFRPLVVLGCVHIDQQIRRKPQDRRPVDVTVQDRAGAVLKLGELGEELPFEQVRRRHHVAVPHADDGGRLLAVGVEHGAVLVRRHERLIGEREHGGSAVWQVLDRRAERASHPAGELQVDGMADGQPLERCQGRLVLASYHDQDIVEARGGDLPDRPADERLAAERQEKLWRPHPCRSACREHHCADHENSVSISLAQCVTTRWLRYRINLSQDHLCDARVARHARHCRGRRLAT